MHTPTRWKSHVFLLAFSLVTLFPVLWVVKMALRPEQTFATGLNPLPTEVSFQNFVDLFSEPFLFLTQQRNSVIVSAATTLIGVFLACTSGLRLQPLSLPRPAPRACWPSWSPRCSPAP
jgi:arabinogalactan oligomer/maltooligosaccharide transport system permease protein